MSDTTNLAGQRMVPSGAEDGHTVPIHAPGASEEARARHDRQREDGRRREEHRAEVRRKEDEAYEAKLKQKREESEAAQRERAVAATAERRAAVERDARLRGVPDHQVKAVVDAAMLDYHKQQASDVATQGARADRELRDYFLSRPTPACPD